MTADSIQQWQDRLDTAPAHLLNLKATDGRAINDLTLAVLEVAKQLALMRQDISALNTTIDRGLASLFAK